MSLTVPVSEIVTSTNHPLLAVHDSWERAPLGEIASILNGAAFKSSLFNKDSGWPLIRIRDVGKTATDCLYDGPFEDRYIVEPGELLVGMDGDFRAKRWSGARALLNQRVCKITLSTDLYTPGFLDIALPGYLDAIREQTSSVTVAHLSSLDVAQIPLPLPPLAEQRRIVAKVEELLARVNAARERLAKVPTLLKRFRQSILAAACDGRLTADVSQIDSDPPTWARCRLDEVGAVTGGITKNANRSGLDRQVPYLRVANVYENRLELDDVQTIGVTEAEFARTQLADGDLLFVEGNGSIDQIGRVARWDGSVAKCVHQNHLIRLRVSPPNLPEFVLFAMMAKQGREQLIENAVSSAGLHSLSISKVAAVKLDLPPPALQREIVCRVAALFALSGKIEARVQAATARIEKITQAILAKAFRGELVPTEAELARAEGRDYEPASVLLDRIRAQRAATPNGKPSKNGRSRQKTKQK